MNAPFMRVHSESGCIGHLLSRGPRGVEAFDAGDTSLGTFATAAEAAAALSEILVSGSSREASHAAPVPGAMNLNCTDQKDQRL
jgi:hypothetical protein